MTSPTPDPDAVTPAERALWGRLAGARPDAANLPAPEDDRLLDLAAYADGRLDAAGVERVEAWLADSSAARAALVDLRGAGDAMTIAVGPIVLERARRAMAGRVVVRSPILARLHAVAGWGLATAASLAICFAGYHAGRGVAPAPGMSEADEAAFVQAVSFGTIALEDDESLEVALFDAGFDVLDESGVSP